VGFCWARRIYCYTSILLVERGISLLQILKFVTSIQMVIYFVCCNLSLSPMERQDQLAYWLDFLVSALALPSTPNLNWVIIPIGLQADLQQTSSKLLIGPHSIPSPWRRQWSNLPISDKWFVVSSTTSHESVKLLLKGLENECSRIFQYHAISIPSTYHELLREIQGQPNRKTLCTLTDLYNQHPCGMGKEEFLRATKYLHTIGRILVLDEETVCVDPTHIPKVAAQFISPENTRLELLNFNIPILTMAEIGCMLEFDTHNNEWFVDFSDECACEFHLFFILFCKKLA
jgi:hypothetical protein